MKKKFFYMIPIVVLLIAFIVFMVNRQEALPNDTSSQSEATESETQQDMQVADTETGQEESDTRSEMIHMVYTTDWRELSWEEILEAYPKNVEVHSVEQEFNSEDTDLTKWFADYNGEDFQIIPASESKNSSVGYRREVIFYRTDEADVQKVLNVMLTGLIDTLMVDSEERPYTVTRYELDDYQHVKQINENVWILSSIEGYYSYEGTDMGTMEQVMPYEKDIKDGMIRFFSQGSSAEGQYILIRNGDVYKLQRAEDMGFGIEF